MTVAACPRCAQIAHDDDRFCGGCGLARREPASLTRALDDALSGPTLSLAATETDAVDHRATPDPAATEHPAPPTSGPAATSGPGSISARQEIREVISEVAADWRGMSGADKAGTVAVSVYNGFATLWNVGFALVVVLVIGFWLFSGCSAGLSASSTCYEYLKTDQQTRYTAAQTLGRQASGATFKGPMAGLNLDYSCSYAKGTRTIGSIMGIRS